MGFSDRECLAVFGVYDDHSYCRFGKYPQRIIEAAIIDGASAGQRIGGSFFR